MPHSCMGMYPLLPTGAPDQTCGANCRYSVWVLHGIHHALCAYRTGFRCSLTHIGPFYSMWMKVLHAHLSDTGSVRYFSRTRHVDSRARTLSGPYGFTYGATGLLTPYWTCTTTTGPARATHEYRTSVTKPVRCTHGSRTMLWARDRKNPYDARIDSYDAPKCTLRNPYCTHRLFAIPSPKHTIYPMSELVMSNSW